MLQKILLVTTQSSLHLSRARRRAEELARSLSEEKSAIEGTLKVALDARSRLASQLDQALKSRRRVCRGGPQEVVMRDAST